MFLFARHGETLDNDKHEYVSHSNVSLSKEGEQQAHDAGDFIAHLSLPITKVISSPLARTQETAAIICNMLHIPEFYVDDRLTDLDVGDFTGKVEDDNPIDEYLNDHGKKFPNGESINDFQNRQHDFAEDVLNRISSGEILAGSLLVVTHAPIIAYWYNIQNPNNPRGMEEELVHPGGVVSVTDDDVFPLYGQKKTPEEQQNDKMDPAVVLYMPPEALGEDGAACGTCVLGITEGENAGRCVSVYADSDESDTHVNLEHGVCGIYVKGKSNQLVQIQPIISRTAAGYIDKGAPTNCGICEYFTGGKEYGCRKVDGRKTAKGCIESGGCCNRWETVK